MSSNLEKFDTTSKFSYLTIRSIHVSAVVEAASAILDPFYARLHEKSLEPSSIPSEIGVEYAEALRPEEAVVDVAGESGVRELTEKEFYAQPEHLRGLGRVVDPLAPDFMASR